MWDKAQARGKIRFSKFEGNITAEARRRGVILCDSAALRLKLNYG
jgi:hypothetical protein